MANVTQILRQLETGDLSASEQLLPLVYDELRKLAAARMASERPNHTLQATALVHEAYVRLVDRDQVQCWESRSHFFAAAAEAMRRILVDSARRKQGLNQRVDANHIERSQGDSFDGDRSLDLMSINDALDNLACAHPQSATVVKLRYFCGMTIDETAAAMGVSHATVERCWAYARARLHAELNAGTERA